MTGKALIIGFGNTLRGDDGFGQAAAVLLGEVRPASAAVLACHQLTPELAERLAAVELAVFIDAAAGEPPGRIAVHRLQPAVPRPGLDHFLDPAGLLALALRLYGRAPEAFLVSVGAASLALGESLSEPLRAALPEVIALVGRLVASHAPDRS